MSQETHRSEVITVPRPHVPLGPAALHPDVADGAYLRRAAREIETHCAPFSPDLRATVVKLVHDAAEAVTSGQAVASRAHSVTVDPADPRDSVLVTDPGGHTVRVHRQDADLAHHDLAHRLATARFGRGAASTHRRPKTGSATTTNGDAMSQIDPGYSTFSADDAYDRDDPKNPLWLDDVLDRERDHA